MASQQMVFMAAKSFLAAVDDFYYPPKWVNRQIQRTLPEHYSLAEFKPFQTGNWIEKGIPAESVTTFVQTLCSNAVLELFYPGSTKSIVPAGKPEYSGDQRVFRAEVAVPFKNDDGRILLHFELERQVTISFILFLVWSLCGGRTLTEVAKPTKHYLEHESIGLGVPIHSLVEKHFQNSKQAGWLLFTLSLRRNHVY